METTGTTSPRSILEKPLNQLTEEDISQLTREDCRKFLKEKGMRRPSWNKSQAVQQVISLKALLEVTDDSGALAFRKPLVPPRPPENLVQVNSNSTDSQKEPSSGAQVSVSADDTVPHKPTPSVEVELGSGPALEEQNKGTSPRGACALNGMDGQMTIFYCGKVNVYDGVPPDKAQTIMHIAASPMHLPRDDPVNGSAAHWSFPFNLHSASDKPGPMPTSVTISQVMLTEKMTDYPRQYREKTTITRDPDVEGQASRKVSLQRYLEKRKDRGRFKSKKDAGLPSSSLEMYLHNQVKAPISNAQLSRSSTSSPTQPTLEYALCSSANYHQPKVTDLNVDLNDKGSYGVLFSCLVGYMNMLNLIFAKPADLNTHSAYDLTTQSSGLIKRAQEMIYIWEH